MTLDTTSREDLIRLIKEQRSQIKKLRGQLNKALKLLEKLQHKLKETPIDSSTNPKPHFKANTNKQPANRQRKLRTQGFARTRDNPTHIVNHICSKCPDCGGQLHHTGRLQSRRQVIDIPMEPATVTEHRIFANWCPNCRKEVFPEIDLSDQVLGKHRVSLKLMSTIATLREQARDPIRTIQKHLQTFYQLHLSCGEISEILHTVAKALSPAYDQLRESVRGSPVVFGDETGWRENGQNGYLWNFSTPEEKYLLYQKSRGQQVVREVLDDDYEGVLVSDFYGGYNCHMGYHQRCWVHLIRDIDKLLENYPDNNLLQNWVEDVLTIYREARRYTGPDTGQYPTIRQRAEQRWEQHNIYRDRLLAVCQPYIEQDTPMTTLCKRVERFSSELFLFVVFPEVPSDNNTAERHLRPLVISRKISGGTRSPKGSKTKFILASLFGTWIIQHKNPFEECLALLKEVSVHTAQQKLVKLS